MRVVTTTNPDWGDCCNDFADSSLLSLLPLVVIVYRLRPPQHHPAEAAPLLQFLQHELLW